MNLILKGQKGVGPRACSNLKYLGCFSGFKAQHLRRGVLLAARAERLH